MIQNFAFMSFYRHGKGQDAFMVIEADSELKPELIDDIKRTVTNVKSAYIINSI